MYFVSGMWHSTQSVPGFEASGWKWCNGVSYRAWTWHWQQRRLSLYFTRTECGSWQFVQRTFWSYILLWMNEPYT